MHLDLTKFWVWGQVTIEDYLKMNYGWILSFVIQVHRMFFHLFRSKYFVLFNTIIAGIISLIKFLVMQLTFVSWSCFFQPCWTCLLVVIGFLVNSFGFSIYKTFYSFVFTLITFHEMILLKSFVCIFKLDLWSQRHFALLPCLHIFLTLFFLNNSLYYNMWIWFHHLP